MQTSTADPVPVAICCAHRLFRDALAATLSARPEFTVVGDVGDPDDLLPLCRLRTTELVLCCADDAIGRSVAALAAVRAHCPGASHAFDEPSARAWLRPRGGWRVGCAGRSHSGRCW